MMFHISFVRTPTYRRSMLYRHNLPKARTSHFWNTYMVAVTSWKRCIDVSHLRLAIRPRPPSLALDPLCRSRRLRNESEHWRHFLYGFFLYFFRFLVLVHGNIEYWRCSFTHGYATAMKQQRLKSLKVKVIVNRFWDAWCIQSGAR